MKLRTNISQAFWCQLSNAGAQFDPALIFEDDTEDKKDKKYHKNQLVSWFDTIFDKGIYLPDKQSDPLVFLITGPPGSGKSTLALELCYRVARNKNGLDEHNYDSKESELNDRGYISAFISTEASSDYLIENAKSFGWHQVDKHILKYNGKAPEKDAVTIFGKESIDHWETLDEIVATALESISQWLLRVSPKRLIDIWKSHRQAEGLMGDAQHIIPDILVIDSLNIIPPEKAGEFFQKFIKKISRDTKLVFFVLDSGTSDGYKHNYWEFVCDAVIKMDYSYIDDYYVRTLEVTKARYQSHVLGKHQVKIYGQNEAKDDDVKIRRDHPYRTEGGIFIYPSIHYYLSRYKRRSATRGLDFADSWLEEFNDIIKFPEGRCTAFIGGRGGHKSHLGFVHVLHRLTEYNEAGLVISLREDEGVTKSTIQEIIVQQFNEGKEKLEELEAKNRFEILYFPPGYITPEEFFHRVFMSVHRLKQTNSKLTVLFNSLDQLTSRFPLCAKQEIFIPGMIEAFSGENITSIFIAVDERGQPIEQYGLLPMADLIISFSRRELKYEDYYNYVSNAGPSIQSYLKPLDERAKIMDQNRGKMRQEVGIQVVRFAGGKKAGDTGILELVDRDNFEKGLFSKQGLYFVRGAFENL